jgi:hypothetical protein
MSVGSPADSRRGLLLAQLLGDIEPGRSLRKPVVVLVIPKAQALEARSSCSRLRGGRHVRRERHLPCQKPRDVLYMFLTRRRGAPGCPSLERRDEGRASESEGEPKPEQLRWK